MAGKIIHKSPMKGHQVVNAHNLRKTFMIFTEGQTEEGYFKSLRLVVKQSLEEMRSVLLKRLSYTKTISKSM